MSDLDQASAGAAFVAGIFALYTGSPWLYVATAYCLGWWMRADHEERRKADRENDRW